MGTFVRLYSCFLGIHTPSVVNNSLDLIGKATSGVAVFVTGMTIDANIFKLNGEFLLYFFLKNIALPIIFMGVVLLFHMQKG